MKSQDVIFYLIVPLKATELPKCFFYLTPCCLNWLPTAVYVREIWLPGAFCSGEIWLPSAWFLPKNVFTNRSIMQWKDLHFASVRSDSPLYILRGFNLQIQIIPGFETKLQEKIIIGPNGTFWWKTLGWKTRATVLLKRCTVNVILAAVKDSLLWTIPCVPLRIVGIGLWIMCFRIWSYFSYKSGGMLVENYCRLKSRVTVLLNGKLKKWCTVIILNCGP